MPIRVLLSDDHILVRAGIRVLLENIPGIEVVAEADDGRTALELVARHKPDVVLMDISMRGLNGLEATRRIVQEHPDVRVIILSMHNNPEYAISALRAGAAGYLLKEADTAELEIAVRAVTRGETYLSPPVSSLIIADYLRQAGASAENTGSPVERLTPRQREILQLIAEGHSVKEIAQILGVSVKTVETHRALLMDRLSIYDTAGLVRFALRHGLISQDE